MLVCVDRGGPLTGTIVRFTVYVPGAPYVCDVTGPGVVRTLPSPKSQMKCWTASVAGLTVAVNVAVRPLMEAVSETLVGATTTSVSPLVAWPFESVAVALTV
jgi:hypothetical protein